EGMRVFTPRVAHVLQNPLGFAWRVLKQFKKNQGLLLAGAIAYYALLSVVPLTILVVIALSHLVDQGLLLTTLQRYLEILVPGLGALIVTLATGALQKIGQESVDLLGHDWSLKGVSGVLLYLLGLVGEIFVLSSVYMVMPVGRLRWKHALIGGATA